MPRLFSGERAIFSTNGAGELDIHKQKYEAGHLAPCTKINSK